MSKLTRRLGALYAETANRGHAAWRGVQRTAQAAVAPSFIASLLLVAGMALSIYAAHLLAGHAWSMLVAAVWLLLAGVVLLRGLEP
jgi:hypothetical protein